MTPYGVSALESAAAVGIGALYAALARGRMGIVSPITAVVSAAFPVAFGLCGRSVRRLACACRYRACVRRGRAGFDESRHGAHLAARSGDPFGGAQRLAIGALYIFLSRGHQDAGLWLLVPTRITSVVVVGGFALVRGAHVTRSRRLYAVIAASGALDMAANVLYVLATHGGMLAIVAVITSLYPATTVFLARVLLERAALGGAMGGRRLGRRGGRADRASESPGKWRSPARAARILEVLL